MFDIRTIHREKLIKTFGRTPSLRLPRGFALITVLVTILLVVVLLTAVFQSQRSRSSVVRYDRDKEVARSAALSVLEYARFSLEREQTWLNADPLLLESPLTPAGTPIFNVQTIERVDEAEDEDKGLVSFTVTIEGTLRTEHEIPFTLVLTNNLANAVGGLGLAPNSCSLDVTTAFGTSQVHHIWILRHAAFVNATVAASGDIELDTETVTLSSTDSARNQIRSMSNVYLPRADRLRFDPGNGWNRQEKGTVWAYDDIRVGPEDDPTPLDEAADKTGAQFIPNGRSAYRVPKLEVGDVGADPEVDDISEIANGEVRVGHASMVVQDLSGLEHTKTIPVPQQKIEGPSSVHFVESELQAGLPPLDLATVRFASDPDNEIVPRPSSTDEISVGGIQIHLLSDAPCQLYLPADRKVVCQGSLKISGFSSTDLPVLEFTTPPPGPGEESPRGYLECKGGELTIACNLKNAGMLMASGDVNVLPSDVDLAASLSSDLAIFAGGDVHIDPTLVSTSLAEVEATGRKLAFRGLIYAAGDVVFDTVSDHKTQLGNAIYFRRKVEVEGGIVARAGQVRISGEYGAELKYNPDFLDDVMESSLSSQNRQLEIVSAREF